MTGQSGGTTTQPPLTPLRPRLPHPPRVPRFVYPYRTGSHGKTRPYPMDHRLRSPQTTTKRIHHTTTRETYIYDALHAPHRHNVIKHKLLLPLLNPHNITDCEGKDGFKSNPRLAPGITRPGLGPQGTCTLIKRRLLRHKIRLVCRSIPSHDLACGGSEEGPHNKPPLTIHIPVPDTE